MSKQELNGILYTLNLRFKVANFQSTMLLNNLIPIGFYKW